MAKDIVISIPKNLAVGFADKSSSNYTRYKDGFPKSFLTYFDKEDSSFKNRLGTLRSWTGLKGSRVDYENKLEKGFTFGSYHSRYRTDNKWFDIEDPRGFTVEISAENITRLISTTNIHKGVIQEQCIWARKDGINFLVAESDELYQEALGAVEIKIKDLVPGDIVILADKSKATYLGHKYVVGANRISKWNKDKRADEVRYEAKRTDKAYYVFKPHWSNTVTDEVDLVSSAKILKKIGTSEVSTSSFYQIRQKEWGYKSKGYLFDTKKEANEYDVDSFVLMVKLIDESK